MKHNFGEKTEEYNAKTRTKVEVWQSPKYKMAKEKAIEMIDSGKYGLSDGDFWILMNATKNDKMMYSGLIISHNGCLKINDNLDESMKFKPECVTLDKEGYKDSLVYTYKCPEQGIYEVGEVSLSNCRNEYPYAMAFKRLFDRVVLKLSRLAYSCVYSDSESEEFKQQLESPNENNTPKNRIDKVKINTLREILKERNSALGKKGTEKDFAGLFHCNDFTEFDIIQFKQCVDMLKKDIKNADKKL